MLKQEFVKKINFFLYKKKHLAVYILIGFLSLVFELSIRKIILYFLSPNSFSHIFLFFWNNFCILF